jgi:hypothetical protein
MKVYNKENNKTIEMEIDLVIENLYYDSIELLDKKDKDIISDNEGKIPLYDIYTSNLYLIYPENLFRRITYNHYRFPSQKVLEELERDINLRNKDINLRNKDINLRNKDINLKNKDYKSRKFKLMKKFLSNFNLKILEDTFYRVMYKYSPELGRNLLFCKRPSFNKYIHNSKPYYTKTEIVNMARNMGIELNVKSLSSNKIDELCEYIKQNDINSDVLLSHQKHIIESNMLGLVQYYTVQGSANLNSYLRNPSFNLYLNEIYNKIIKDMKKLCTTAPAFDKNYILYRFIKEDSFLNGIKVGQIFVEKSFMSTTRDAFYRSDTYSFGFILIKINVPKNKKGIALSLETCSHFPEEQEIIFPPGSRFKLISKDSDTVYYHTDLNFTSKVQTKYEFDWVGVEDKDDIDILNIRKEKFTKVNFLDTQLDKSLSLTERIKRFTLNLNQISQFETEIGKNKFKVIAEKYNSIGAYKNFYGIKTENGFSLYCIYDNYLLFFIEIGIVNNIEELHFNYYVRYNTLNKEKIVSQIEMIDFIASVAYYFALDRVIIYSDYKPCFSFNINKLQRDTTNITNTTNISDLAELTGNYCEDIYLYLKEKKKRFFDENVNEIELTSGFSFYDLDYLKTTNSSTFFNREDDELYQIYEKSYKEKVKNSKLSDYFIWIIENKCYLTDKFIKKLGKLYDKINPFKRDMYIFSHQTYLYNRGKISAFYSYYNFDTNERENNLIRTDEFKRLNLMNRDLF